MIIVFKPKTSEEDVRKVASVVEAKGLTTHIVVGEDVTICGVIGDTTKVDPKQIEVSSVVERVMHVSEPYKLANRAFHPDRTGMRASSRRSTRDRRCPAARIRR